MLRRLNELNGYTIEATDGRIGAIEQAYFDDDKWTVRYLVVRTGAWLDSREILLSPMSLGESHWETRTLNVRLTKDMVKHSPSIDLREPLSRPQESQLNDYYGWSSYWGNVIRQDGDPQLRSSSEVVGYHLHALDHKIGHVEDFIIDDQTWAIRYLVIDTSNWGMGKKVLIALEWIGSIRANHRLVDLRVSKDAIRASPKWEPDEAITPTYEASLRDYYRRRQAWSNDPRSNETPFEPRTR